MIVNLNCPRCYERAKPEPVLVMRIGFFACFHAISLERSHFSKIATLFFCSCSTEAVGIAHISRLVACSARIVADKPTHRTTTVTLHACRGLIIMWYSIIRPDCNYCMKPPNIKAPNCTTISIYYIIPGSYVINKFNYRSRLCITGNIAPGT